MWAPGTREPKSHVLGIPSGYPNHVDTQITVTPVATIARSMAHALKTTYYWGLLGYQSDSGYHRLRVDRRIRFE